MKLEKKRICFHIIVMWGVMRTLVHKSFVQKLDMYGENLYDTKEPVRSMT